MANPYEHLWKLPYHVKMELHDVLNANENWKRMAALKFRCSDNEILRMKTEGMKPNNSAGEAMLLWAENRATTTDTLFRYFHDLNLMRATIILQDYVSPGLRMFAHVPPPHAMVCMTSN